MTGLIADGELERLKSPPPTTGVDGVIRLHATDTGEYVDVAFRDGVLSEQLGGDGPVDGSPDLVIHGPLASVRRILLGESTVLDETRHVAVEGEMWALMSLPQMLVGGQALVRRSAQAALENHLSTEVWSLLRDAQTPSQGFQLFVGTQRSEVSIAEGVTFGPRPMRADILHHVRCATKPFLALAAHILHREGHLDLETPLCFLTEFPSLLTAQGTLRDVLCHDAGLASPRLAEAWFAGDAAATQLDEVRQVAPLEQYSEIAGWHVLAHVMRKATGYSADALIRRLVLDPFEIDCVALDSDVPVDAIGTYFAVRGAGADNAVPLLMDLTPTVHRSINAVWGGVASAQGLGRLYRALLADDAAVAGLVRAACSYRRGPVFDPVLRRQVDFSAGFMVDLAQHGYGSRVSRDAFGYTGWMGSSWGLADPTNRVCCAFIHNGFCSAEVNDRIRGGVLEIVYDSLSSDGR